MISKNNPYKFEINWESRAPETCQTGGKGQEGDADAPQDFGDDDNDEDDHDVEYCWDFAPHMITKNNPVQLGI